MAGITQVWRYNFGCLICVISPYSNGAVQIRVGLELADNNLGWGQKGNPKKVSSEFFGMSSYKNRSVCRG